MVGCGGGVVQEIQARIGVIYWRLVCRVKFAKQVRSSIWLAVAARICTAGSFDAIASKVLKIASYVDIGNLIDWQMAQQYANQNSNVLKTNTINQRNLYSICIVESTALFFGYDSSTVFLPKAMFGFTRRTTSFFLPALVYARIRERV